jgi:hypothetical protein
MVENVWNLLAILDYDYMKMVGVLFAHATS